MSNVQLMRNYLSDIDQWILVIASWCTIAGFIWSALNVASEEIIKANKEKRRLEKLNGVRK